MMRLLFIVAGVSAGCAVLCFCCTRIVAHGRATKLEQRQADLRGYTQQKWQAGDKRAKKMEEGTASPPPLRPKHTLGKLANVQHDLGKLCDPPAKLNLKRPVGYQQHGVQGNLLIRELAPSKLQDVHWHNGQPTRQSINTRRGSANKPQVPALPASQRLELARSAQSRSQPQRSAHGPRASSGARRSAAHSSGGTEGNKRPARGRARKVAY
jgi:hypothetical protein